MSRAGMPRNGHGHDADGAGAGDEHILADHIEGERRVSGIAERVEYRGDLIVDGGWQLEDVGGGNRQILRKRARAIHTHAGGIAAEVAPSGAAIAAMAAGDVALSRDAVAGIEAAHLAADFDYFS